MDELNEDLRNQAIHLGLCSEWQNLWKKDWSKEKMVERMYKGIDFCLKHHYPSNEYILKHFDLDFRRKHNVFVNDRYSVCNPEKSLVLGNSCIKFRYNAGNSASLHARDSSEIEVTAKTRSFVVLHLHDSAKAKVRQYDMAKVVVISHSKDVSIDAGDNIDIKTEYSYLK